MKGKCKRINILILFIILLNSIVYAGNVFVKDGQINASGSLYVDQNVLHVDSSNNRVGIGMLTPETKFHINETGGTANNAIFESSTSAPSSWIRVRHGGAETYLISDSDDTPFSGGAGYTGTLTNYPFIIRTNNDDKMIIDASGVVGIGTTSVWTRGKLHIKNGTDNNFVIAGPQNMPGGLTIHVFNDAVTENRNLEIRANNTAFTVGNVGIGVGATNPAGLLHIKGNDGKLFFEDTGGSPIANFSIRSADGQFKIRGENQENDLFIINETTGDVGIGTLTPAIWTDRPVLTIEGDSTNNPSIELSRLANDITDGDEAGTIRFYAGSPARTMIVSINVPVEGESEDAGDLRFYTKPTGGSIASRMQILSTGQILMEGNVNMSGNKIINLSAPTAGDDAVNKAYADASGGGSTFEGLTSMNYTGNLGGIDGANTKCDSDYSGSHICTVYEIISTGQTSFAQTSWVYADSVATTHSENCFSYTSDHHYWVYENERTLHSVGQIGYYCSIAVRNDGTPIIAFRNQTSFDLVAYTCDDPDCISGETVDIGISNNDGLYTDIAVKQDGDIMISHQYDSAFETYAYDCDDPDCSSGNSRVLSASTTSGYFTDIEIGINGSPIIVTHDTASTDNIVLHYCVDDDCTDSYIYNIDILASAMLYPSMDLRENGSPVISLVNTSDAPDSLHILLCDDPDCLTYTHRLLDDVNGNVESTDVEIRHDGRPAILYFDESDDDLRFYDCFDIDCLSGTSRLLESTSKMGDWDLDLEIWPDGRPLVLVFDNNNRDLDYYHCLDEDCSKGRRWSLSEDDVGAYANYEIRHDGAAVICHHKATNYDIAFGVLKEQVQGYVITRKGNIAGTACNINRTIACCS